MPTYEIGDEIEYGTFGGDVRRVRVTGKYDDVKNGRPGFDAEFVEKSDDDFEVWGYDDQIVRVLTAGGNR